MRRRAPWLVALLIAGLATIAWGYAQYAAASDEMSAAESSRDFYSSKLAESGRELAVAEADRTEAIRKAEAKRVADGFFLGTLHTRETIARDYEAAVEEANQKIKPVAVAHQARTESLEEANRDLAVARDDTSTAEGRRTISIFLGGLAASIAALALAAIRRRRSSE